MKNVFLAGAAALVLGVSHTSYAAAQTNVMFILDASNSMWAQIDGKPKIEIAKKVLTDLVNGMPEGTNMGLISYGHRFDHKLKECGDMELMNPIGHFNREQVASSTNYITPNGQTPIADTLLETVNWLEEHKGENTTVVLITDGVESCNGDPCAAATTLTDAGISTKIHVVGFDLSAEQRAKVECVSANGNGKYFDARDATELTVALEEVKKDVAEETPIVVAQAEPEPAPEPTEPSRTSVFLDNFDGEDLSEHWSVTNPNPDNYIVEDGSLLIVSGQVADWTSAEMANIFSLTDKTPKGDWDVEMTLTQINFDTNAGSLKLGLRKDELGYLELELTTCQPLFDVGVSLFLHKVSSGTRTSTAGRSITDERQRGCYTDNAVHAALKEYISTAETKMIITKRGKAYSGSINIVGIMGGEEKTISQTTDILTSLRNPGDVSLSIGRYKDVAGEANAYIDSVEIFSVK